jgi:CRISPR/Cas system Type II protein with McrA/HNH and RuvC-like nuclease domain
MEQRKTISKKLRFEIFKRDGFQCAYCGQSPPIVVLEVDHIEPKSKGGQDHINNYITACFDCNRGKKNIPLDKIAPQLQQNLEVLREKEEQLKEYRKFVVKIEKRINGDIDEINNLYNQYYPKYEFTDHFKQASVKKFIQLLPLHEVKESLIIAATKHPLNADKAIPYFCGVCWNKIKGRDSRYK